MNNKEFLSSLAHKESVGQRDAAMLARHMVAEMTSILENGNRLSIADFGDFDVTKRMERVVTNPTTGQRMLVPPRLVVTFEAAASLEERTQKGGEA